MDGRIDNTNKNMQVQFAKQEKRISEIKRACNQAEKILSEAPPHIPCRRRIMPANGVHELAAAFESVLVGAIDKAVGTAVNKAVGPAVNKAVGPAVKNSIAPLEKRMDTLEKNVQAQIVFQHKKTVKEVNEKVNSIRSEIKKVLKK